MRYLLLSDIHANIAALAAVIKDAGPVDGIWCAGDLVDYGTDPHEVVNWCLTHEVQCVSGNHDRHLLDILSSGEVEAFRGTKLWKWVHDNCQRVTEEDVAYLRERPMHLSFVVDGVAYLLQHQMQEGSMAYQMPQSVRDFDKFWEQWYLGPPTGNMRRCMVFGHTHRRCVHLLDKDRLWINPGSVSYRRPDDPDKRAHYMIVHDGCIEFHAVWYDRTHSFMRAMEYAQNGCMMDTEIQDAMFFFGNAETTRDALLEVSTKEDEARYE